MAECRNSALQDERSRSPEVGRAIQPGIAIVSLWVERFPGSAPVGQGADLACGSIPWREQPLCPFRSSSSAELRGIIGSIFKASMGQSVRD